MEIQGLLSALELDEAGAGSYRARNMPNGHGVVFGGQLLAQSLVAAARQQPDKRVKTVHCVFARSASFQQDLDVDVEVMHGGRAFGSVMVTIRQGDRLCTRALVLLSAEEPDLIRHAEPLGRAADPDQAAGDVQPMGDWQIRSVSGLDVTDPSVVAPPEYDVWSRFPEAPDDPLVAQALLAYASDGFLIATAMLPHEGVGQSQAHVSLSTGVVSHTLTFHDPLDARAWHLLAHRSTFAGGGRAYGRGDVYTTGGALVASFVQDAMIRPLPGGPARTASGQPVL